MDIQKNVEEGMNILEIIEMLCKKVFNYVAHTWLFLAMQRQFISIFGEFAKNPSHFFTQYLSKINQRLGEKSLIWGLLFLLFILRAPLLKQGHLFMLDRVIMPKIAPLVLHDSNIFNIFLYITQFIFPTWVGEKILWIGIFALGGWGIIRLYNIFDNQKNDILRVVLVAFLWINPFIYARTLDGHLNVVTITMILPWLLYFIYKSAVSNKAWYWNVLGAVGAFLILGGASPHGLLIGLGVSFVVYAISLIMYKFRLSIIINGLLVTIGALIVNSWWLLPSLRGETDSSDIVGNFDSNHLIAFQTHDVRLGIYLNPLALRGYRGEIQQRILEHHNNSTLGRIALFVFWSAIVLGIGAAWKKNKKLGITMLILLTAAWILGQGNNPVGIFAQFNNFLFDNVPGYIGMRDPQKWVSVLVVIFAILASQGILRGIELIQTRMSRSEKTSQFGKYSNLIITALLLVPLLYTSNQLRGRNNQLHIASYPESWNKLKSEFSTTPVDCEIKPCHTLVTLPWHSYMDFGFAQRVISNPLPVFIGKDIVWGPENVEFGNLIYSQNELSGNIVDEFIGGGKGFWWINQHMQDSTDLIERTFLREKTRQRIAQLKKHGVSHFIIVFESDYKSLDGLVDYLILNGFAQSQDIQNEYELLVIK